MHRWPNRVLWVVYLALLGVLLPHTAWALNQFEPPGPFGTVTAWAAAFAFEAAIAVLTHKLARHIERTPRYTAGRVTLRKTAYRYINAYAGGLVVAMSVSAMANLAHAVQFGGELAIFTRWNVPFAAYAFAFGAILPLVSLLFARVLSNVVEAEQERDAAFDEMRGDLADAERRADQAERRFEAVGDLAVRLFAAEKRQRILAAHERWPELPQRTIAVIADASVSYVHEMLKEPMHQKGLENVE